MAENSPLIGRTLAGRFRITGYIGEGGMAAVYRGVQDGDGRNVAIKVMNAELVKDRKFVRRFRREAKAASMLKHPNTVEILEFGVDGETVYLAMECIEGLDLAMVLERDRRIPEARAANIVMQVCNALAVAHAQNIVHRDLKPDNIMVLPNPKDRTQEIVKVLDFGIAKILDEDEGPMPDPRAEPQSHAPSLLTRVGTIVGTPAYMSPEQGRAEKVDARTDVYACGVLLYELVTGRTPFGGETPMQVVMRHVNEPPLPPSNWVEIHPELEKIILKALMKWAAERQQSAQALSNELRTLMADLATQKRPLANQNAPARTASGDLAPVTAAAGSAAMRAAAAGSVASNPRPAAGMPAAAAPATARAPAPDDNDDEPSTLMIPDGAAALLNHRPQTGPGLTAAQAKAAADAAAADKKLVFPTLNIDLPEDLEKAGLSGPRTAPRGTPSKQPTLESAAPLQKAPESSGPPSDDDDDARTVVRPPTGQGPSLHEIIAGAGAAGLALAQTLASPIEDHPKASPKKDAPPPAAGTPAKPSVASTLASEPGTTEGSGVHPVPGGPGPGKPGEPALGLAKTLPIGAVEGVREPQRSLSELAPELDPIHIAKTSGTTHPSTALAPPPSQIPKKGLSVGMAMVLGALIGAVIVGALVVVLVSMR